MPIRAVIFYQEDDGTMVGHLVIEKTSCRPARDRPRRERGNHDRCGGGRELGLRPDGDEAGWCRRFLADEGVNTSLDSYAVAAKERPLETYPQWD